MNKQTEEGGAKLQGWTSATVPSDREVTINVRFNPDGSVNQISQCPAKFSPQDWFTKLVEGGANFQALAGGRGAFHLQAETLSLLQKA